MFIKSKSVFNILNAVNNNIRHNLCKQQRRGCVHHEAQAILKDIQGGQTINRAKAIYLPGEDVSEVSSDEQVNDSMSMVKSTFFGQTDLTKVFPSRNKFQFANGITIDSNFENGNLMTCEQVESSEESALEFDAHVCPDGYPYIVFQYDDGREPGLFFAVNGVAQESIQKSKMKFNFKHLTHQDKLIQFGHRPVYVKVSEKKYQDLIQGKSPFFELNWEKIPGQMEYISHNSSTGITFDVPLPQDLIETDRILVSYTYPYTLSDIALMTNRIETACKDHDNFYFNREVIGQSLENRDLEMITLSSKEAFEDEKPVVFFTCRVHPGEAPGQYMLQGILEKLLDFSDPQTQVLLDNYVFKIIPVVNLDGVARGQWRFDTNGQNLNRKFHDPSLSKEPTVLATKEAILEDHNKGNLKMYIDFHAHKTKRGCFIYGNKHSDIGILTETKLLPKLMSLNSVNFDMNCTHFLQSESKTGNAQEEVRRDGSGRSVVSGETQLPLVYTIEANYARGKHINHLEKRYNIELNELLNEEDPLHDSTSYYYGDFDSLDYSQAWYAGVSPSPEFSPEMWQDVGHSVLYALLDYDNINPITRLISNRRQSLEQAVDQIRDEIRQEIIDDLELKKELDM